MKKILEDIKNSQFKNVYLLYGAEGYLKKQYRDRLCAALLPEGDTMNFTVMEGKGLSPGAIIDLGETMPFFAKRRVILLQDTGFFKGQAPELAEYVGQLPEYLCMIFVEEEVDKRGKLYKNVKQAGTEVEFSTQDTKTLIRWVFGNLKRENKKITQPDMELFLEKTGTDMGNIEQELEKLLCYTMDKDVITRADIEAVCTTQINNRIFDMVRAVAEKQQKKALDLYYDLLALKEPPMRILFLLARQFEQLMQVKELEKKGRSASEIAKQIGIRDFVVRNYMRYAKKYSGEELREAVEAFTQAEEDVKTGKLGDVLSVELLIIKYSR